MRRSPTRVWARVHAADLWLFRRLARAHTPVLDATLPRLTRAADHSKLWLVLAAALGRFGGRRGRRAGLRGTLAVAIASALVNTALKGAVRRMRPDGALVPAARRLRRMPRSSSFPSGHSASAAAFATGVALEHPVAGAATGALATLVGTSRVYTGAHYPSDVVMGFAAGASAALATLKLWPRARREPARPTLSYLDVDRAGDGVAIAVNTAAGSADDTLADTLAERFAEAEVVPVAEGEDLQATLRSLAARASVVGVAGGDGSINTAASIAHGSDKPLVVIPGGTLNHLARDLGIASIDDAAEALAEGCAARVDLATIAGKPFVNTASFGPYPELVDERERRESRIGKWPALVVALVKVLGRVSPVEIEIDGVTRRIWLIFIGNCRYEPHGLFPAARARLDDGLLDVRIVSADHRFALARLLLGVVTGTLGRSKVYEQRAVRSIEIRSHDGPLRLSRDGETFDGPAVFRVEKLERPLRVLVKKPDDQSRASERPTTNSTASNAAMPSPVSHGPALS